MQIPRVPVLFLAAVAVLSQPTAADEEAAAASDAVVTLTKDNFDDTLKQNSRVLVEFYAPWCGHCKSLEPEYKQAAEEMREEKLQTVLAKVDATQESEIAQKYEVSGYPTLKYFVKGQAPKTYEGGRTASAIKSWLSKRELPVVQTIEEDKVEEFLQSTKAGEFALVARVAKKSARGKAYWAAAEGQLADFEDVKLKLAAVLLPKSADPKADASLTMFRPGFTGPDPERHVYDGKWTEGAIAKWVKTSTYPTVGDTFGRKYTTAAAEAVGKDGSVVVLMEDGPKGAAEEKGQLGDQLQQLVPVAKAETRWLFTVTTFGQLSSEDAEALGAKGKSKSMVVILQGSKKYLLAPADGTAPTPSAVEGFLSSVKSKKAKPYYKSASDPGPDPVEDGVTVLVGDTFEQYALDSKKDVFVEFYAPWCGHCKKLAPELSALANKVKESGFGAKGVLIAKMDSTENECEEEVTGYPKLVLYPAVKADKKFKAKQVFGGQREMDPMWDFLLENARNLDGLEDASEGGGKKKSKYSMLDREKERKKKAAKNEL